MCHSTRKAHSRHHHSRNADSSDRPDGLVLGEHHCPLLFYVSPKSRPLVYPGSPWSQYKLREYGIPPHASRFNASTTRPNTRRSVSHRGAERPAGDTSRIAACWWRGEAWQVESVAARGALRANRKNRGFARSTRRVAEAHHGACSSHRAVDEVDVVVDAAVPSVPLLLAVSIM